MNTNHHHTRYIIAAVALLFAACSPKMDAPDPKSPNYPKRPEGPPQVIFLPDGIEINSLAIDGDHLYGTAKDQDQVYRFDISDMLNLSLTASAVPYVKVPGANAIAAGANHTLFIGSSGAPKAGATEHKWTDEQVIYVTQATESWHSRFANNPAQKLFVAPRGSFNALTVFNNNLYYAAETALEGMTIFDTRYQNSLKAISNLLDPEFMFLLDLAFGNADFSNFELADILNLINQFHLNINLTGIFDETTGELALDDLANLALPQLEKLLTFDYNIDIPSDAADFLRFLIPNDNAIKFVIPISVDTEWRNTFLVQFDIPIKFSFDLNIYVPIEFFIEPQWGLHLVSLWYGLLEVPKSIIDDLITELFVNSGLLDDVVETLRREAVNYITPFVAGLVYDMVSPMIDLIPLLSDGNRASLKGSAVDWAMGEINNQGWIQDPVYGVINTGLLEANLRDPDEILKVIKDYRIVKDGQDYLSLNGVYKDNGGNPPRPYVMGVPISPTPWFDEDRTINQKLALTLALVEFIDESTGNPFVLLDDKVSKFDPFVALLEGNADILTKIKGVVELLDIDNLKKVVTNDKLLAYLDFVTTISDLSFSGIMTTLDGLFTLLTSFDPKVTIDFRQLLEAWWDLPDWGDLPGTHVGSIAPHELLGSLYAQMDQFVESLGGVWTTLAGWVTSKIPRVNSAAGWWYGGATYPTGIAFSPDPNAVGNYFSWVVDNGVLYSRRNDQGGSGSGGVVERDDYRYLNDDGSTPYINPVDGKPYYEPSSPWTKVSANPGNRWRLNMGSASTGQSPTALTNVHPTLLSNCHSVVYDPVNQVVLVSCDDGASSSDKGRVVSVRYRDWFTSSTWFPGFNPPPPRQPYPETTLYSVNASFDVFEYIPADGELNHPKGMAIKDNFLFIADGNRIVVYYTGP